MNCHGFQHEIYEYLDGTLSLRAQAAAAEHLSECAACRKRVGREQQFARSLSEGFRRATDSLELPPVVGRRVLAALADQRDAAREAPGNVWFWRRLAWPLAMAASLLLLLGGWFFLLRAPGPGKVQPGPDLARGGISIQLSYVMPVYTFREEGGFVIDALSYHTTVVNERLPNEPGRPQ
jgi:anti-sigma factor RsiW